MTATTAGHLRAKNQTHEWVVPALLAAYFLAFYCGFRPPNLWSINYYIPSMSDGFFRRSLIGTVLSPLGDVRLSYAFIATLQVSVFLSLNLCMIRAVLKDRHKSLWLLLFLVGPGGGYFFHLLGYVDQLLFLVLLCLVRLKSAFLQACLMVGAMFIHEMTLFFVLPAYVAWALSQQPRWQMAALPSLAPVLGFGLLYLCFQTTPIQSVNAFVAHLQAVQPFDVRSDFYAIYSHKFTGERMHPYYGRHQLFELMVCAGLSGLIGLGTLKAPLNGAACVRSGLCALAPLAPLMLGMFGWDTDRWIFLSVSIAAFLLFVWHDQLWIACRLGAALLLGAFMIWGHLAYFDQFSARPLKLDALEHFWQVELPSLLTHLPRL